MGARVAILLLIAAAALTSSRSLFVVDQTQSALCTRFGRIEPTEYGPGLHFKSPLEQVHRFDRRVITRAYAGDNFLTSDNKPLNVDFYLKWRLTDARDYYQATGGDEDMASMRLADVVSGRIKTAIARQPLAAVAASARGGLGDEGFEELRTAARELGLDLLDVQLQRVDLTDEAENTVYQRMEQSFTARAQQLHAQAATEADKTRADADLRRAEILADALKQAQHLRGEADGRAASIYAAAYARNPDLAAMYHSLQAYKNIIGRDGDIVVVTPQGEFFKYLHSASGH
jgi:membrane protease subunit HflC